MPVYPGALRVADAPILDGPWAAVESAYANRAKRGPVLDLDLPPSFHPDWSYAKIQWK